MTPRKIQNSKRRGTNRQGRFTSCEESWSSGYDVRGTVGEGLRHARKVGQVATTCEEQSEQPNSYDVRGTVGAGLRRARKFSQVATTCEEPSGQEGLVGAWSNEKYWALMSLVYSRYDAVIPVAYG
ncbi:hypothetical protein Tco_1227227 [Tanacetum coccineum]